MQETVLELINIKKIYGPETVLGPLSLYVNKGEAVGIIGANGAGKSTLLKIAAGVEKPDGGKRILHADGAGELGYVPQELALYSSLTGRQNLKYWAAASGISLKNRRTLCNELLERVNLSDKADKRVSTYSGGMKRRLNLVCAMVGKTKLLLLDEPTVGADTASVELMVDAINRLKTNGCAVLLVSHYKQDIDLICDRTITLERGKTV